MVAALGLGKFYGSGLPRPRFYTDIKLNGERVDPPLPVMDPLLAWAEEAHWSMGGTSMTRHRLQGRIEGNVNKLRVQRETVFKKSGNHQKSIPSPALRRVVGLVEEEVERERVENGAAASKMGKNSGKIVGMNDVQSASIDGGGAAAKRSYCETKRADLIVVEAELSKVKESSAVLRRREGVAAAGIRSSPRLKNIARSK